ncbi:MAG: hypothetical protein P4M11_06980 [Candidatus Pacebacteria bacterium]|nr:hypothetical protein [Candidatus Paceibacterota bacterium]
MLISRIGRNLLAARRFGSPAAEMISHSETRVLPFSGAELQSVIKDVPNYSKFVPFCSRSRVHSLISPRLGPHSGAFVAEIVVGFMSIECPYLSDVHYRPGQVRISRNPSDRIFHELQCVWDIQELDKEESKVVCSIRFALANSIYNYSVSILKTFLICKMNQAFVDRAYAVYDGKTRERRNQEAPACRRDPNSKYMENLRSLKEGNKLGQNEFEQLILMLNSPQHFGELEIIDNAYGGNKGCEDLYVASLRKLMRKYKHPIL